MKKITLVHISTPDKSSHYKKDKCYNIFLGNGLTVYFSDYRKLTDFLIEVNELLNFNLVMINQLYSEIHCHYRRVWFYINNLPEHESVQRQIISGFHELERSMELTVTRSHFPNGNFFTFKYFFNCLDLIGQIVNALQDVEKHRKACAEQKMLKSYIVQAENIRSEISSIGLGQSNIEVGVNRDAYIS